jgi:hypothetical protein
MATVEFDLVVETSPAQAGIQGLEDSLSRLSKGTRELSKGFDGFFGGLASGSARAGDRLRSNLISPITDIERAFSGFSDDAFSFGGDFVDSFVTGFSSAWRYDQRVISDIADEVEYLFQFAGSPPFYAIEQAGRCFINSFRGGIEAASPGLLGGVAETASQVVDTLLGSLTGRGDEVSDVSLQAIGGPFLPGGSVMRTIASFFKGGGLYGIVESAEDIFLRFFGESGSIAGIFTNLFGAGGKIEKIFGGLFGSGGVLSGLLNNFSSSASSAAASAGSAFAGLGSTMMGLAGGGIIGIGALLDKWFGTPYPAWQAEQYAKEQAKKVESGEYQVVYSGKHKYYAASSKGILGEEQSGTPYIPETGLYRLHQGEAVVPAWANPFSGASFPKVNPPEVKVDNRLKLHVELNLDGMRLKRWVIENIENATKDGVIKLHPIAVKEF